jgi:hypothetical protein
VKQFFHDFCQTIIKIDPSIRYFGIADGHGHILAAAERPGLLGKINYTCSHYDRLLRSTIPITDDANHLLYVLIFTFDVTTENFHEIITQKIIPLVDKNIENFISLSEG